MISLKKTIEKNEVLACLFSGGCDSTLVAALGARTFKRIHLLTYTRFGFFNAKNPLQMAELLRRRFGKDTFITEIIKFGPFFKYIQYHNYIYYLKKYGTLSMSICGLCKLAMHWQTIVYCLKNSICHVHDGSVKDMKVFPAQNEEIALNNIKKLYAYFSIKLETPIFDTNKQAEEELYKLKIIPLKKYKGTNLDNKQVSCSQQILFTNFVESYLSKHSWEEYVTNSARFFDEKIEDVKQAIIKNIQHDNSLQ